MWDIYCISNGVPIQAVGICLMLSAVGNGSEIVFLQVERPPDKLRSEVTFALGPR